MGQGPSLFLPSIVEVRKARKGEGSEQNKLTTKSVLTTATPRGASRKQNHQSLLPPNTVMLGHTSTQTTAMATMKVKVVCGKSQ